MIILQVIYLILIDSIYYKQLCNSTNIVMN